jgi:hypothetical protein
MCARMRVVRAVGIVFPPCAAMTERRVELQARRGARHYDHDPGKASNVGASSFLGMEAREALRNLRSHGIKEGTEMVGNNIRQWIWSAAAGVACGVLGWTIGNSTASSPVSARADASARSSEPAPHTLLDPGPSIVVAQDGNVTLHVDREPLKWVLAEINRQAGSAAADTTTAPMDADAGITRPAAAPAAPAVRTADATDRVMRGTEPERYEGLVQAQNGGAVSDAMLKTLYETDASPRVRLLAFDYALESTEGDTAARRGVLEAARLLPDAVVAQEAARRLDAMPRDERGRADEQQLAAQQ